MITTAGMPDPLRGDVNDRNGDIAGAAGHASPPVTALGLLQVSCARSI